MSDKLIRTAIMLTLFIALFACSNLSAAATPSAVDMNKEEQAIYSLFVSDVGEPPLILEHVGSGFSSTDPQQSIDFIQSSLEGVSNATVESYTARNAQPGQLAADMDLGVEYRLLKEADLQRISSQPNWNDLLSQEYPGAHGYLIFSRVGFNPSLDQAVISVGHVEGPMMGSGSFFLLEKQNGQWTIKQEAMAWIS